MILHILSILLITAGLILVFSNQIPLIIWAQEESMIESTTGNVTESTTGNVTESTTGNVTESTKDDNLQQNGIISRKST